MAAFDLSAPPDLASGPASIPRWGGGGVQSLCDLIDSRFDMAIDRALVERAERLSDIADAIDRAQPARSKWGRER